MGAVEAVRARRSQRQAGPRSDGRRFFDAILWLARSGARWRDLPEDRFGPYQTVKRRYYRWIDQGVFDRIFEAVAADPDMEWLSIDATVIRAQAQAAGGRRKRGGPQAQALGSSRGGFGSKIHAVVGALGLPVRFHLGPGQQNHMAPACDLVRGLPAKQVLASPTSSAGASRVSSPSSNNGDASPHAMTNSQPISSASSSWQASCFGSNS